MMLEKFLKLKEDSILYTSTIVDEINFRLDEKDRIQFAPLKELGLTCNPIDYINNVENLLNYISDNYSTNVNPERPFLYELNYNDKLTLQTFKLSNYNKLSSEVNPKIRNYIFEVVDYFKRNGITNFDGKITFCFNKKDLFVYLLRVKENDVD